MRKIIFFSLFFVFLSGGVSMAALVDNGDGTVTDTTTGLMWQKATAPGTYTWQQALVYAEALDIAGQTDWRLPNSNELLSLVDYSRVNPSIDPLLTPNTVSSYYWSSTTEALMAHYAWSVYFRDGTIFTDNKSSGYYVRAVRGGLFGPLTRFLTLPLRNQAVVGNGWDYNDQQGLHCAIDYFVPKGTPVVAAADGYAMGDYQIENGYGYGNLIIIRHDETDKNGMNYFTLYAHLSEYTNIPIKTSSRFQAKQGFDPVKAGWIRVRKGQQIGKSGDSGGQTWQHLHFSVFLNWNVRCKMDEIDPYDLYARSTATVNSSDYYPPKMSRTIGGKTRSSGSLYTESGTNRLWISDPPSCQLGMPWLQLLLGD